MLELGFTRISPTHHRLDIVRSDGSAESVVLETRSGLAHDFIHLALETEAGLKMAFFGLLESGFTYGALSGKEPEELPAGNDAMVAEAVIGGLTRFVREGGEAGPTVDAMRSYLAQIGALVPVWLTAALATRVKERYRRLNGEWKATPFNQTMSVRFGE